MSELKARLQEDMKSALKAKEKLRLSTIRLILAAVKQREIDEKFVFDDSAMLALLEKLAKQRKESIAQYQLAGRDDLVAQEQAELEIIQSYLPEPLSEQEVLTMVDKIISESGAQSIKDMGKVMGLLKDELQGRADMSQVSGIIKEKLTN